MMTTNHVNSDVNKLAKAFQILFGVLLVLNMQSERCTEVNRVQSPDFVRGPITALAVSVAATDSLKTEDAHIELRRGVSDRLSISGEGSPCLRKAIYGGV